MKFTGVLGLVIVALLPIACGDPDAARPNDSPAATVPTTTTTVQSTTPATAASTSLPPEVGLTPADRAEILAAASLTRLDTDNSFGGGPVFDTVDVIQFVGHATSDGFVDLAGAVELTDAERAAITEALGARTIRFVPVPDFGALVAVPGYTVLSLAAPVVDDGQVTVTTGLWCGNLCGTGGGYVMDRRDGAWVVSDQTSTQWIS